jgi:hypothetical protein
MSYEIHNENQCDKCAEEVGKENLKPIPFLYLDRNDAHHPDAIPNNPKYKDYKQYKVCENCRGKY